MEQKLYTLDQAKQIIEQEKLLVIAGDEKLLRKLPKGKWIGGTIPYFMSKKGGVKSKNQVFVNDFSECAVDFKINLYSLKNIEQITTDSFENGFSFTLFPHKSNVLEYYALNAQSFKNLYQNPILGWVTGNDININKPLPKVFNGLTTEHSSKRAIALHIKIPDNKVARMEIFNNHTQANGPEIKFPQMGFSGDECEINGEAASLVDYILDGNVKQRTPLIADYSGATICVGVDTVKEYDETVHFFAPVYPDIAYKFAEIVDDAEQYAKRIPYEKGIVSAFKCVTNYLVLDLEGKKAGKITGPFTFGEIAYLLVNETLVYLIIEDAVN